MTNDEAEKLARELRPSDKDAGYYGNALSSVDSLRALCDHILSGDMKREIENAAYKNVIKLVEEGPYGGDGLEIADAIRALIQPPAQQKENGE